MAAGSTQRPSSLGPSFPALLAAAGVTNLGDGLRLTALPLLATRLTSSPLLISGITAAQFLPWTTFAPFGGVIVDRSDRRRLILVTQAWRGIIMIVLTLAVFTDMVEIWHLFVVAFTITVGEILVDPSVVAIVPSLVTGDDLDTANGQLNSVEVVANEFAGGPIGAATFGLAPWLPFLLDALSYLGSIVPFGRLPSQRAKTRQPENTQKLRRDMGVGVQWIWSHPFLRPLTLAVAVFHLGTAGAFALLVLLVRDTLGAPEFSFGVILFGAAIGATGASLTSAQLAKRFSRRVVITGAAATAATSVAAAAGVTSQWQLFCVWSLNGAAAGIFHSVGRGFVQRHTPNDRLGRAAIASRMITRTSFTVGALTAGGVAAVTSVRWSFVVAGSLHLIGALLLWRSFRHEPD